MRRIKAAMCDPFSHRKAPLLDWLMHPLNCHGTEEQLKVMIDGKRLKEIADLLLDLAV